MPLAPGVCSVYGGLMNEQDQAVAWLEANRPAWQVFYETAGGTITWHARRWDDTGDTLSADDPAGLADAIDEAEGRQR